MDWYLLVFRKFADFSGRSARQEFWMFALCNFIVALGLAFVGYLLGRVGHLLVDLYSLVVFIPALAVSVRRLHDIGKSGWWLLIEFVPVIGFLVLLYFMVQDSEAENNAYGPSPKALPAIV
jgi:uncharacterized membrane protein YhaH (DUF805 family)